jgi:hypothetical protein
VLTTDGVLRSKRHPQIKYQRKIEAKDVPRSSTEEKYKHMEDATVEVMWVQSVLQELAIHCPRGAQLWCDKLDAKYLASYPIFNGRIKHVKIDYHFVRDRVL